VKLLVFLQVSDLGEGHAALGAVEGLVTLLVNRHVRLESGLPLEHFSALLEK
jgi:hypothetical protein